MLVVTWLSLCCHVLLTVGNEVKYRQPVLVVLFILWCDVLCRQLVLVVLPVECKVLCMQCVLVVLLTVGCEMLCMQHVLFLLPVECKVLCSQLVLVTVWCGIPCRQPVVR